MSSAREQYGRLSMRGKLAVWASIATIITLGITLFSPTELREAAFPSARAAPPSSAPNAPSAAATTSDVSGTGNVSSVNTASGSGNVAGNGNATGDGSISVGDIDAKDNATTIINTGEGGVHISTGTQERHTPAYPEPSDADIRDALLAEMQGRGAVASGPQTVAIDNPLAGMALEIVRLEKLGCEAAVSRAGYVCDYRYAFRVTAYSNEGSAAGDNHAQGVNLLIRLAMGGQDTRGGTASRRFIKSNHGWVVSDT